MESAIDKSIVERAIGLKSSLTKLRSLLNVDGESNVPQWCKDRMQELEEHLKEEKFIRSKQEESYDALSKYNKELSGQMEQLTKSRDTLEEKLHRSEEAVHLEKKLLENKEKKWKEEKIQFELQNSQKDAKIETLTARNAYYRKENGDFKDDHRRVREIQKEMDQLKEQLKQKETENETLKQEMAAKQETNETKYKEEVQKREAVEKRLEETEASMNQELKESNEKLEKVEGDMTTAAKSLASFLKVIEETIGGGGGSEDDDDHDDDSVDLNLESNVSKIGVAIENLQSIVADAQDETAELKQDLESTRKKWHESQGNLMDLQEDYEIQEKRIAKLEQAPASANANGGDEEGSYDSQAEIDDDDEMMETAEAKQPDASDDDDEVQSADPAKPTSAPQQDDSESDDDDDDDDIVEVQPPLAPPASEGVQSHPEQDRDDDDDDSDIVEIQPPPPSQKEETKSAKRPLQEDAEEEDAPEEDKEDEPDHVAPTAKRARVDEESDDEEGSTKSVTFGIDDEVKEQDDEEKVPIILEDDDEDDKGETKEDEKEPAAKRAKRDEDSDSDGSGYGSF